MFTPVLPEAPAPLARRWSRRGAGLAALGLAMLSAAAPAWSQKPLARTLTPLESRFLDAAARNGLAEIAAAQLALGKARTTAVRAFAQQMADDHAVVHRELASLATSRSHALPRTPDAAQQARIEQLAPLEPHAFERRYVEAMGVQAHQASVALFEEVERGTRDRDIQEFAARTLLDLRRHLELSRTLHETLARQGGR